jgi:hypothetical protein
MSRDIEQIVADPKSSTDELRQCIRLLEEEITGLRNAAFYIHNRGWLMSGSYEMATGDALCQKVNLPVWQWPVLVGIKDSSAYKTLVNSMIGENT